MLYVLFLFRFVMVFGGAVSVTVSFCTLRRFLFLCLFSVAGSVHSDKCRKKIDE